jgi:hypothetical protein
MDDKIFMEVQQIKLDLSDKIMTLQMVNNNLQKKSKKIIFFNEKIIEKLKIVQTKNEIPNKYLFYTLQYLINYFEAKTKTKLDFILSDLKKQVSEL